MGELVSINIIFGKDFFVDTSSAAVRNEYKENALTLFTERQKLFRSINVDHLDIRTDIPYTRELFRFFRMRERRM